MRNFPDKIIIDAPPALREAIQRRIVQECSTPEPQPRKLSGGRGANWKPPADPAGYEGLIPQNDAEWLQFARVMFPGWSEKTAMRSIGAWKKRVWESTVWWLEGWQERNPEGWAQWVEARR